MMKELDKAIKDLKQAMKYRDAAINQAEGMIEELPEDQRKIASQMIAIARNAKGPKDITSIFSLLKKATHADNGNR